MPPLEVLSEQKIDDVILKYQEKPGFLMGILEEIQDMHQFKYLPEETLKYISFKTKTPLSRIYSVVTFYSFFNLKPQGKHTIMVCRGTACHTRGSKSLLDELKTLLDCPQAFEDDESFFTTEDNLFTIRTVACFGQCALAPVVCLDGVIHSHVNSAKLKALINKIKTEARA